MTIPRARTEYVFPDTIPACQFFTEDAPGEGRGAECGRPAVRYLDHDITGHGLHREYLCERHIDEARRQWANARGKSFVADGAVEVVI